MSARSEDRPRLELEDGIGCISTAEDELRVAALRITHRMRTAAEREDLEHVNLARVALRRAMTHLARLHPQAQGGSAERE